MPSGSFKIVGGIYEGSDSDILCQHGLLWNFLSNRKYEVDEEEFSEEKLKTYGWELKVAPKELVKWSE